MARIASDRSGLDARSAALARAPEFTAIVGTIAVFAFFAVFTGSAGFLSWAMTRNYLEVAAEIGIIAAPITLLIIAGEFDLSVGSTVAAGEVIISYLTVNAGWPFVGRLRRRGRRGDRCWRGERMAGREDQAAVLHHHAGHALHHPRGGARRAQDADGHEHDRRRPRGRRRHSGDPPLFGFDWTLCDFAPLVDRDHGAGGLGARQNNIRQLDLRDRRQSNRRGQDGHPRRSCEDPALRRRCGLYDDRGGGRPLRDQRGQRQRGRRARIRGRHRGGHRRMSADGRIRARRSARCSARCCSAWSIRVSSSRRCRTCGS